MILQKEIILLKGIYSQAICLLLVTYSLDKYSAKEILFIFNIILMLR